MQYPRGHYLKQNYTHFLCILENAMLAPDFSRVPEYYKSSAVTQSLSPPTNMLQQNQESIQELNHLMPMKSVLKHSSIGHIFLLCFLLYKRLNSGNTQNAHSGQPPVLQKHDKIFLASHLAPSYIPQCKKQKLAKSHDSFGILFFQTVPAFPNYTRTSAG